MEKDRCKEPRHPDTVSPGPTVTVAQDLAAGHWAGLAVAVGGSREVYREEGISKEMNTEGHSGSREEPGEALGKRTRYVGHQPLAGY